MVKTDQKNGFAISETRDFSVRLEAYTDLPSKHGDFIIAVFSDNENHEEHTAIIQGTVSGKDDCPLRIHSQCQTGDIFGSLRCDCQDQLNASLKYISSLPHGVVIYLKQEGRGIGLVNKIRAYQLQDIGYDTVDANICLGFPADARDYRVASEIIQILEIESVALLTNNPRKIDGLREQGIVVTRRIPIVTETNPFNAEYLKTKRDRMGHLF